MKYSFLFFIALLVGLIGATCNYDPGRGVVLCSGTDNSSNVIVFKQIFYAQATVVNPDYVPKYATPKIVNTTKQVNTTNDMVAFVKSAAECQWARDRDWETYIGIMYYENTVVDMNANPTAKNQILDNLLQSKASAQYLCRTGVLNK